MNSNPLSLLNERCQLIFDQVDNLNYTFPFEITKEITGLIENEFPDYVIAEYLSSLPSESLELPDLLKSTFMLSIKITLFRQSYRFQHNGCSYLLPLSIANRIPSYGTAVYAIINTISNTVYVGCTNHLHSRICNHVNNLIENKHCNNKLQEEFNVYNIDSFKFKTIKLLDYKITPSQHIEIELLGMKQLQQEINCNFYNITTGRMIQNYIIPHYMTMNLLVKDSRNKYE